MLDGLIYRGYKVSPGSLVLEGGAWDGLTFRKELIYKGAFLKKTDDDEQPFEVNEDDLAHWANTGNEMVNNGVKVPTPLKHTTDPEAGRGEVRRFEVGVNDKGLPALFGVIRFRDAEAAKMAASTDVSIYVPNKVITDGKGRSYARPIRHVCFTDYPVIPQLSGFKPIACSFTGAATIPIKSALKHKTVRDLLKLKVGHIAKFVRRMAKNRLVRKTAGHAVDAAVIGGALTAAVALKRYQQKHNPRRSDIDLSFGNYVKSGIKSIATPKFAKHLAVGAGVGYAGKKIGERIGGKHSAAALGGEITGHLLGGSIAHHVTKGGLIHAAKIGTKVLSKHPVGAAVGAAVISGMAIRHRSRKSLALGDPDQPRDNMGRFASTGASKAARRRVNGGVRQSNRESNLFFRDKTGNVNPSPNYEAVKHNVSQNFHELLHIGGNIDEHTRDKGVLHAVKHASYGTVASAAAATGLHDVVKTVHRTAKRAMHAAALANRRPKTKSELAARRSVAKASAKVIKHTQTVASGAVKNASPTQLHKSARAAAALTGAKAAVKVKANRLRDITAKATVAAVKSAKKAGFKGQVKHAAKVGKAIGKAVLHGGKHISPLGRIGLAAGATALAIKVAKHHLRSSKEALKS